MLRLSVKAILFLIFWQKLGVSVLAYFNFITATSAYTKDEVVDIVVVCLVIVISLFPALSPCVAI